VLLFNCNQLTSSNISLDSNFSYLKIMTRLIATQVDHKPQLDSPSFNSEQDYKTSIISLIYYFYRYHCPRLKLIKL